MKTLIILPIVYLLGCASSKPVSKPAESAPPKPVVIQEKPADTPFDPSALNDSWDIKPKTVPIRIQPYKEPLTDTGATTISSEATVIGFRVQIGSTTNYYEALVIRDSAGLHIADEIYLDYEPPYYKVRVGNYLLQQDAEISKNLAKSAGYHDAWIVRTKIIRRQNK